MRQSDRRIAVADRNECSRSDSEIGGRRRRFRIYDHRVKKKQRMVLRNSSSNNEHSLPAFINRYITLRFPSFTLLLLRRAAFRDFLFSYTEQRNDRTRFSIAARHACYTLVEYRVARIVGQAQVAATVFTVSFAAMAVCTM